MTETLQTVLEGKAVNIKGKYFMSASSYVQPFIDRLQPYGVDFKCQVKLPDAITLGENSKLDIAFMRVSVTAIFPKTAETPYRRALTMAYALDLKIPVVKFYVGALDDNDNFIVFDKDSLILQRLEPDTPINYNPVKTLLEKTDNIKVMLDSIKKSYLDRDLFCRYLGEWIDFVLDATCCGEYGKVKLASSAPVDVYKMLIKDSDSEFYVPTDHQISVYDVYSAFLSLIRDDDRDIINRFEKTWLVDLLLKL
jgi:hypothetical protein